MRKYLANIMIQKDLKQINKLKNNIFLIKKIQFLNSYYCENSQLPKYNVKKRFSFFKNFSLLKTFKPFKIVK